MKILISVLLGTLLFVESAQSLRCYVGVGVNKRDLRTTKTCRSGESFCGKIVMTPELGSNTNVSILDCTTSCAEFKNSKSQLIRGFVDASCCSTDLCNGVGLFKGNPWALAGALLFSLGIALLWMGL
ncbi:lymphocyte antigen 6H-like [Monodelphis domestica]|uniref:lymphocyte antigen 6H-like n=1 Tax=Monodelphis domestica TaxID=13616 RepID=UPI0000F2C874|nr:lymphocyte antigen 6H-like [Monodelphis domestica]XP_056678953.1 lymphocyte antigen 6H-like [Monodelphis domestica]XP_056678954.1 lymphocyte antigen 6H-like [Monodelphis domestica]